MSRAPPHRSHTRKKLEGVRPIRRVAGRSSYERRSHRSLCERHPKRRKSRPRLRRRRLRPGKHRILTAACPPSNLSPVLVSWQAWRSAPPAKAGLGGEGAANVPHLYPSEPPTDLSLVLVIYIRCTLKFLLLFCLRERILASHLSRAQPAIAFADILSFLRREEKGP